MPRAAMEPVTTVAAPVIEVADLYTVMQDPASFNRTYSSAVSVSNLRFLICSLQLV